MNRRLFVGFLTAAVGALLAPAVQAAPSEQETPKDLEGILQEIIQCAAKHPGAEVLCCDDPRLRRIGWMVMWSEGPGHEGQQSWFVNLTQLKTDLFQNEAFSNTFRELFQTATGRKELATRLQEAGEALRVRF